MKVGVILNRVFRLENNPLFEYISQNKEDMNQCYFIIPQEKFDKEAEMKANYYYGTLQKFVDTLHDYDIQPFLVDYDELTHFAKIKGYPRLSWQEIL